MDPTLGNPWHACGLEEFPMDLWKRTNLLGWQSPLWQKLFFLSHVGLPLNVLGL